MSEKKPKVSCLTATRDRLVLLKEAIRCFCDQTYPERELIIVNTGSLGYQRAIESYLLTLGRSDVRLIYHEQADATLGGVRNLLLDAAEGELVCQWDDDDFSHPRRLERQIKALVEQKVGAIMMADHLHYFWPTRDMYWVDWSQLSGPSAHRLMPGTLLMYRDHRFRYPEEGPFARRGEDSVFIEQVAAAVATGALTGEGYLYVYNYHGRNVFDESHHQRIACQTFPLAEGSQQMEALAEALPYYRLPLPYSVHVGRKE